LKAADIEPALPGMLEAVVIADLIVVLPVIKNGYLHKPVGCIDAHRAIPLEVPEKYKSRSFGRGADLGAERHFIVLPPVERRLSTIGAVILFYRHGYGKTPPLYLFSLHGPRGRTGVKS